MKILLAIPVTNEADGYTKAAIDMFSIFFEMWSKGEIENLQIINIFNIDPKLDKRLLEKEYDVAFCTVYPLNLLTLDGLYLNWLKTVLKNCKKKYMSIVWETDKLPDSWDELWKLDLFDGYLAPSHFVENLIKEKTNKPIYYYPHLLNCNLYKPIDIEKKKNENIFKVLFLGQYTIRKGIQDAIIAFIRELGECEDAELYIKYSIITKVEMDFLTYLKYLLFSNTEIKKIKARIFYLDQKLDFDKLNKFFNYNSVMIFPTRGEGFGLPPSEAMTCGLPVIYTNWSAPAEICESPYNYPVDYYLDEAHSMMQYSYEKGLKFAVPSITSLMEQLRKAYEKWKNDKEKYYTDSFKNRQIIIDKYGRDAIRGHIKEILKTVKD